MNEFLTTENTAVIARLVQEVVNDPSTYLGSKYIPAVARPVNMIRAEILEASGGLSNEHIIGTDPLYIQRAGSRVQTFSPPAYREKIRFDEKDILDLRELGQNDTSGRGIQQYLARAGDRLNRRLEARIEKLRWDAIFNGSFSYAGETFSYGIPSGNQAVPVTALWSLDSISANNLADPVKDLRYWLEGGLSAFRKYVVTKIVMNPNTARWILDNTNVQSLVKTYFSAENFGAYEVNKTLQMLIPGCPPAEVYKGWYQTESSDADGKITVSDGIYMIPDGYLFFEAALPGGDKIGEFVQGLNLAGGSIENPSSGKFLMVEDNTGPGTKGGPSNPYIDFIAGMRGGVNLFRQFDVLTAKVID